MTSKKWSRRSFTGSRSGHGSHAETRGIPRGVRRTLEVRERMLWFSVVAARWALLRPSRPSYIAVQDLKVFRNWTARIALIELKKARLPPDLAFTLRDSSTSRDVSLHPPVLKFVHVNALLPTHGQRPFSHRSFHSSTRARGYHPLTSSALVVSHHLDGLSLLLVVGLLHPTARQDSQCCRSGRPAPEDAGDVDPFPLRIHPSKLFPRW